MNSVEALIGAARGRGERALSEYESKKILAHYGIPTVREALARDLAEAREAAAQIGYPVVLKVCSSAVSHKTEKGLIALDLRDEADLDRAFGRLARSAEGLDAAFLVQEMIRGARELVAGMNRDPQFGPCVMFGLGGIFTEILDDVSFRVAPLEEKEALAMVREIRGRKILDAIRGMEAVDLGALARCLTALGRIGLDHPDIETIDVNPLIIQGGRPLGVDALVVLSEARG